MNTLPLTITRDGLERFTAAQLGGDIDLTVAQVGVTAAEFVVAPTLTQLPGEIRRIATISGEAVGDNIVHMIVRDEAPIAYAVRGFGLYLSDGTLFAVYGQQAVIFEKSQLTTMLLPIDIAFPAGSTDLITFGDTNFLNPPATSETAGVARIATPAMIAAGTDERTFVSPAGLKHLLPIGIVVPWWGASDAAPAGWAICDGRTVQRSDGTDTITTPDLRGRVAVGAGGGTGNSVTSVQVQDPGHDHAVTVEEAGDHRHSVTIDVTQPSLALHFIMRI